MAVKFKNSININDQYTLPAVVGSDGQYLSITDAAAGTVDWVDVGGVDGLEANSVYYTCKNETGSTIEAGTAVMAVGSNGNSGHILIAPMVADGSVEPRYFIGVVKENISNGQTGKVVHFGMVSQINTNAFNDGDVLWCDPNNAGGFTTTEPEAPSVKLAVAIVLNASTNGKILVRVQGNEGLHELHDVHIESATDGQVLTYDSVNGYWQNEDLPEATLVGVAGSEVGGVVTIEGCGDTSVSQSGNTITISSSETVKYISSHNIIDSTTSELSLSHTPLSENFVDLYVSGVYQPKSTYTVSGDVLTFSEPFPLGSVVEAMITMDVAFPCTTTTTAAPLKIPNVTPIYGTGTCNVNQNGAGSGAGYWEYTIQLGGNVGDVSFNYDAYSIPDRFVVEYDGQVVIDTGFVGSTSYDNNLTSLGYTAVAGPGSGNVSFNKATSIPETALVKVIAPLNGTAWDFLMGCPPNSPTT